MSLFTDASENVEAARVEGLALVKRLAVVDQQVSLGHLALSEALVQLRHLGLAGYMALR